MTIFIKIGNFHQKSTILLKMDWFGDVKQILET